ncbi:MAG: type IV secretory system conjugative DNA transfer family protein [Candidatus Korobacteraceae bacterium]|jgi:type IV secretion system protein VirD4
MKIISDTIADMPGLFWVVLTVFCIWCLCDWIKKRKFRKLMAYKPKNVHAAAWADEKGIRDAGLFKAGGIPLGYFKKKPIFFNGRTHLISFGGTGSGKTSQAIIPTLLTWPYSVIAPDVGGELTATCAHYRQKFGKVLIIDPLHWRPDCVRGLRRVSYNPMGPQWLNPKDRMFGTRCAKLAQACVWQGNMENSQRYWFLKSTGLVHGIEAAVATLDGANERNLRRVAGIIHGDPFNYSRYVLKHTNDPVIRDRLGGYARPGAEDVRSLHEVIEGTKAELDFLLEEPISECLSRSDFSFAQCTREVVSVFIILPVEVLDELKTFFRLLIGCALGETMREDGRGSMRTMIMMDEFYLLGRLEAIDHAFAGARKFNVQLWACLQNWPQLVEMYGKLADSFVSNAGLVQWLDAGDLPGSRIVSEMGGDSEAYGYGKSLNRDVDGRQPAHISESLNQQPTKLILPHEVRDLGPREQILFVDGVQGPIKAQRKPYWETELRRCARPNPYYARG